MNSKTTIKEKIGKKFLAKESDKYLLNSEIYSIYYNDKVDERIVYLQSRDGEDFTGNILCIAEELSTGKYGNFKIYVYAKKEVHPKIRKLEKTYNLKIHKTIGKESEALKTLEKAKYIITDSGIRKKYVKRPEQIFLNTWHGTPLKCMGIDNASEEHRIGNVQHPFLSADYLLFPNDFVCEKMINAYMIEKIYSGKILIEGYPRNSVFFDNERREELKSEFNLKDKEIFVYMPTYKGIITNRKDEEQKDDDRSSGRGGICGNEHPGLRPGLDDEREQLVLPRAGRQHGFGELAGFRRQHVLSWKRRRHGKEQRCRV